MGFGILALFVPENGLTALELLFAAYLLADGALAIVAGHRRSNWLVAEGVLGIAAACFVAGFPELILIAFIRAAAVWAVLSGTALVAAARRERAMAAAGGLSILWGVAVYISPAQGVVIWAWSIGAYAILFGALMLASARRLRRAA